MMAASNSKEPAVDAADIGSLLRLACSGLAPMLDEDRGIFCDRLIFDRDQPRREGISERYTAMTLLGLNRYHRAGYQSQFNVRDMATTLLCEHRWAADVGDAGLLAWLFAEVEPSELGACLTAVDLRSVFAKCQLVRSRHTMELAWFLTGVSKAVLTDPSQRATLGSVAHAAYNLLLENRGRSGLFGHQRPGLGLKSWRGRIGSFADQVYPIYALTNFAKAFSVSEALDAATSCANGICHAQGPLGQWWWHYDSATGRVVQRYPVYSVHQEAMAPMALLEVGAASGQNMDHPTLKGLAWIFGENELQQDMRETQHGVVWRCVKFPSRAQMLRQEVANWRKQGNEAAAVSGLTVLRECRPYELGWLLFAFSGHAERLSTRSA